MEAGGHEQVRREWRFVIGAALPADDPLARFIVAVAGALNDNLLAHTKFVESEKPHELLYFFHLSSSHLYEAAETLRRAHREWAQVRDFVAGLDEERRAEFSRVTGLAEPGADWPAERLKDIRNSFFHYLRLDRPAADAGRLPLMLGLQQVADQEGTLVIEPHEPLAGIRAHFADDVLVKTMTEDFDDGEYERLLTTLADYQGDLNRFAQGALGRYIGDQADGIVSYEETDVGEEHEDGGLA